MKSQNKIVHVVSVAFIVSLIYSILRYNIFNGVPWLDFPIYVLNKTIALTIVMLLLYIQINKRTGAVSEYSLWITMFVLIIFHVLLSMVILGPEYYGKFYNSDKLNLVGGLSLLFGILAFLGFSIKGIFLLNTKFDKPFLLNSASTVRLKSLNFLFLGVHLFSMGISGWLMPTKWPGYLLPISLIAFLLLISSIVIFSMQNEKNK